MNRLDPPRLPCVINREGTLRPGDTAPADAGAAGNQTFPAGDYRINPLSDLEPQVVEIRSADGRHAGFVMAQDAPAAARGTQPQLIFDRYGAREFLHAIQVPEEAGATLKPSRSELEAARSLSSQKATQSSASSVKP